MSRNPIARHSWKFNKKRVIENKKLRVKRVNNSTLRKELYYGN